MTKKLRDPWKELDDWTKYIEQMKDQAAEEFLAGDIEGYRRGMADGLSAAKKHRIENVIVNVLIWLGLFAVFALGHWSGLTR